MKKIITTISLCLLISINLGLAAVGSAPFFDYDRASVDGGVSIKLAAQGGLCGRVVLKPKKYNLFDLTGQKDAVPAGIYVRSVLWSKPIFGSMRSEIINDAQKTSDQFGALAKVEPTGLWQRYDWAGKRSDDHYKISCFVGYKPFNARSPNELEYQQVNCDSVVTINEDIKHNVGCVAGPAGPDAEYAPLNMNKA